MLAALDSQELSEWWVWYRRIQPFGDEWRQTQQITQAIYNTQLKGERFWEADDFMPIVRQESPAPEPVAEAPPQEVDEQIQLARMIHKALGG